MFSSCRNMNNYPKDLVGFRWCLNLIELFRYCTRYQFIMLVLEDHMFHIITFNYVSDYPTNEFMLNKPTIMSFPFVYS